MEFNVFIGFAVATLLETLTPGPTMALVFETRVSKGPRSAIAIVGGIAVANVVGVLLAVFARSLTVSGAGVAFQLTGDIGAAYLIYLASRRLLSSAVRFVTRLEPAGVSDRQESGLFLTGFLVHLVNPVTLPYYLATFVRFTQDLSTRAVLGLGAIPVLCDLVVYSAVAAYTPRWLGQTRMPVGAAGVIRLLAGSALLYLVTLTFASGQAGDQPLKIRATTTLLMLIGFLAGAVRESQSWVRLRRGSNNKLLWRVVSLWYVWFSVAALLGGLFTLIDGINASAFLLSATMKSRLRICFVVAAVIAVCLNFAKALGELQDEQYPSIDQPVVEVAWQAQPWTVGLATAVLLFTVFGLLVLTDLRVH